MKNPKTESHFAKGRGPSRDVAFYDMADNLNRIAAGAFTVTIGGASTFTAIGDVTDGAYGRLSLVNTDNIAIQGVEGKAPVLLSNGRKVVFGGAFRSDEEAQIELFFGLVVRGDTTIHGDTNYATDMVSLQTVDGAAALFLTYGRDAANQAALTDVDLSYTIAVDTWYEFRVEIEMKDAVGGGRIKIYIGAAEDLADCEPVLIYTGDVAGLPYDEMLGLAFGAYNGEATAHTVDIKYLFRENDEVAITKYPTFGRG